PGEGRRRDRPSGGTGLHLPVDEQDDQGADDAPHDARGLERAPGGVVSKEHAGEEAADEGAHDSEDDRGDPAHRIGSRHDRPGDQPGDESHDDHRDDSHGRSPPLVRYWSDPGYIPRPDATESSGG